MFWLLIDSIIIHNSRTTRTKRLIRTIDYVLAQTTIVTILMLFLTSSNTEQRMKGFIQVYLHYLTK